MMKSSRNRSRKTTSVPAALARGGFMKNRGTKLLLAVLLLSMSTGCTAWRDYWKNGLKVGPNYCRPAAAVADQWLDAGDPALNNGLIHDGAWWQTFQDPVLDFLVDSAYRQNLSLRVAGLRILEAQAQRGMTAGELLPQSQEAFGDYTRTQLSKNSLTGQFFNRFRGEWRLGTSMAWELDFWGRFRRAIEAADANLDASIEAYDGVLVLLLASVAESYTEVRIAEERMAYALQNIEIQRGSLQLAEVRFREGATTRLDVTQAQSNLAQTEASLRPLEAGRRQAVNQLCILMGIPPQSLDETLANHRGIPNAPPQVAVGIPAELLRRRPDVRRAEREVAAQSAMIGVATSELYPHFSIAGTIYLDSLQFENLLEMGSIAASVGPSFHWNILHYGRLANNIRAQEARFQQLAVEYQNTVLQANAEAENAVVSFLKAQQQARSLADSADAARESVDLVTLQYREGKVDFNRVFNVQTFLTQQQDHLASAQGAVSQSLIQLYKALGGGWQIRFSNPMSQPQEGAEPSAEAAPTPAPVPLPQPAIPRPIEQP